jgi:hypothetical protein
MEEQKAQKEGKEGKILMSKLQNMVQLCEQKEADGTDFFYVRVRIGKNYFWVSFDELKDTMAQFGEVVSLKRGTKQ